MSDLAERLWSALGIQQEWFNKPEVVYDEDELIWKMTAKDGYLFDDSFWQVFQSFPFKICHVSYSGAPWSQEGGPPEMVIRFAPLEVEAVWWCGEHRQAGHRNACPGRVKVGRCPMVEILLVPVRSPEVSTPEGDER